MATERPNGAGDDTGWFFEPQSDEQADLSYRGESPRGQSTPTPPSPQPPATPTPAAADRTPVTPDGSSSSPGPSATPTDWPESSDDTGQATAPFIPAWADQTPPTGPGPGAAAAPSAAALGASTGASAGGPGAQGAGSPGSSDPPGGRPPTSGGTGRAIALGAMIGTIVLLLAWFFLVRDPAGDATRATPVRSSAASVSPSATATPTRTRTTAPPTRTTARPSPTPTSASPTPTPTPTSTLNDASNRLGWTYIIDGLGPVKLGLSAAKATTLGVLQAVPSACDAHSPTELLGGTQVYSTGDKVVAIDIRTDAFPSGRGIRVGTSLDSLKTLYGDALKSTVMTDAGTKIKQWALTSNTQYVAYVIDGGGHVSRIAIGYRGAGGSITLPPPC